MIDSVLLRGDQTKRSDRCDGCRRPRGKSRGVKETKDRQESKKRKAGCDEMRCAAGDGERTGRGGGRGGGVRRC